MYGHVDEVVSADMINFGGCDRVVKKVNTYIHITTCMHDCVLYIYTDA